MDGLVIAVVRQWTGQRRLWCKNFKEMIVSVAGDPAWSFGPEAGGQPPPATTPVPGKYAGNAKGSWAATLRQHSRVLIPGESAGRKMFLRAHDKYRGSSIYGWLSLSLPQGVLGQACYDQCRHAVRREAAPPGRLHSCRSAIFASGQTPRRHARSITKEAIEKTAEWPQRLSPCVRARKGRDKRFWPRSWASNVRRTHMHRC